VPGSEDCLAQRRKGAKEDEINGKLSLRVLCCSAFDPGLQE